MPGKSQAILGICLGAQMAVIEFARNVVGLKEANSFEFDPKTPYQLLTLCQSKRT